MRAIEILNEKPVESTWITNLTYNRPNKTITMKLSNGRVFSIPGTSRTTFERWVASASKGKFWHDRIKGVYNTKRIK